MNSELFSTFELLRILRWNLLVLLLSPFSAFRFNFRMKVTAFCSFSWCFLSIWISFSIFCIRFTRINVFNVRGLIQALRQIHFKASLPSVLVSHSRSAPRLYLFAQERSLPLWVPPNATRETVRIQIHKADGKLRYDSSGGKGKVLRRRSLNSSRGYAMNKRKCFKPHVNANTTILSFSRSTYPNMLIIFPNWFRKNVSNRSGPYNAKQTARSVNKLTQRSTAMKSR